jgi:hypothetical protein
MNGANNAYHHDPADRFMRIISSMKAEYAGLAERNFYSAGQQRMKYTTITTS